jgi:hypothetical protein
MSKKMTIVSVLGERDLAARDAAASGKLFVIASRIAAEIEHAVDALARAALLLLLRDHVTSAR